MTEIVKEELKLNMKELKRCKDNIIPLSDITEEIVKLNFDLIRMLTDYCEQLCLDGESAIEKWLTPPRLAKLKENRKKQEDMTMRDWMDFNGDGEVDSTERFLAEEMLCGSREEHEALFGYAGDFDDSTDDDFETDALAAGLDPGELEFMDSDERAEALEEAGLDPDDYDFDQVIQ